MSDLGLSLRTTLQTIENFGKLSGLKINWDKSWILPLDSFLTPSDQDPLPLTRVSELKYLGVLVTKHPTNYTSLNIEPLYNMAKAKIQAWARLH